MQDCILVTTPLAVKYNLSVTQSPTMEEEQTEYIRYASGMSYLEIVGSLLYVTQTRPNIQFTISIISQFGGNPGRPHLEAAKCILHYLQGTAHLTLTLGRRKHKSVGLTQTGLRTWTHATRLEDLSLTLQAAPFPGHQKNNSLSHCQQLKPSIWWHPTLQKKPYG